jgi:glycosyltransferase involved in cell wall biosynthesis
MSRETTMDGAPRVSVVVPVFNSAATLGTLVERIGRVLDSAGCTHEVILVNDGSRDDTWDRLLALAAERPGMQILDMMRNYGQHNALLAGIRHARGEIIVTMDDDLQHPPEEIPTLLRVLADGYDVVYGSPVAEQHGLWRDLASRLTKLALTSAMGATTARQVSAFRVFRTPLRRAFATYNGPFVSVDVLLTWATTRFRSVAVNHQPRAVGVSHYTLGKLVTHALNMLTGFSTWPLRAASLVGFGFTLLGLVVLCFVVVTYVLRGGSVPGFPFLASIIAIFSGAQMFALGIMGEYLSRIHFRTMERPAYTIREHIVGPGA